MKYCTIQSVKRREEPNKLIHHAGRHLENTFPSLPRIPLLLLYVPSFLRLSVFFRPSCHPSVHLSIHKSSIYLFMDISASCCSCFSFFVNYPWLGRSRSLEMQLSSSVLLIIRLRVLGSGGATTGTGKETENANDWQHLYANADYIIVSQFERGSGWGGGRGSWTESLQLPLCWNADKKPICILYNQWS